MTELLATIGASPPSNVAQSSGATRTKLLLSGPILPTLLRLAAPNVLNLFAFVGVIVFDGFFLGRIGTNALAGASLAFPFVMLVLQTTNSGMGAGVTSAIARALGTGKRERADARCGLLHPDAADCSFPFRMDGRAR
jgi:Na+-driven multidrug efflux pump